MTSMAKRLAKQVLRSKVAVKLDPLPADEKKSYSPGDFRNGSFKN